MQRLPTIAGILWASPYSVIGLVIGPLACAPAAVREFAIGSSSSMAGGGFLVCPSSARRRVCAGVYAGPYHSRSIGALALTFARAHEMVHVRQYERWGPLLGPAYLLCSFVLWLMRRRPYLDNPFEREAYDESEDE